MNALRISTSSSITGSTERMQNFDYRAKYSQKPIPNLHALIIGIDAYEYGAISPLSGAVADTYLMERFLKNDLSVPPSQIVALRDQDATRSAIISQFIALQENPDIQPLDPILIYYAGHGSEVDTPNARKVMGSKTQCIVPQDVGLLDDKGNTICPIPDYTLSALLYDLAAEKGNNITVIFDCCHSASSTRGVLNTSKTPSRTPSPATSTASLPSTSPPSPVEPVSFGGIQARYTDPSTLPKLGSQLDKDILTPVAGTLPQSAITRAALGSRKSSQRGMRSHVLLAACGHSQKAFERSTGGGGYFTSQLLDHLRRNKIDKLTYKSCMENLPALKTPRPQNPVCEGEHVNRFFFNASVPGAHRSFIPIVYDGRRYILKAGMAQGILHGSRLKIHLDDTLGNHNPDVGTCSAFWMPEAPWMSVCRLDAAAKEQLDRQRLSQAIEPPPTPYDSQFLAPVAGGIQSSAGLCSDVDQFSEVRVKACARLLAPNRSGFDIYLTDSFQQAFRDDVTKVIDQLQVQAQAESEAEAGLVLGVDAPTGNATFTLTNPTSESSNNPDPRLLPHTVPSNLASVKHVLYAMSQWNWHVTRAQDNPPLSDDLQIEFYQLTKNDSGDGEENWEEVGDNLNKQGVATIVSSPEEFYGIRVVNNTDRHLYAYPFYFSTANQSIRPLFLRVFGGEDVDASMDAKSDMTMGYGDDDYPPISFHPSHEGGISEDTLDVGILRVFVTTSHADFESVAQPSPFAALSWIKPNDDEYADGVSFETKSETAAAATGKEVEGNLRICVDIDPRPVAPVSAGFAPPSSGFGPAFAGFGPDSAGFGPDSAGFGPDSAGFSPFSAGFSSFSAGFSPASEGFAPSSGFTSPSGFAPPSEFASEFGEDMLDYSGDMPCDGLLAQDADVKRACQVPLWDVIDMKIVIRRSA